MKAMCLPSAVQLGLSADTLDVMRENTPEATSKIQIPLAIALVAVRTSTATRLPSGDHAGAENDPAWPMVASSEPRVSSNRKKESVLPRT